MHADLGRLLAAGLDLRDRELISFVGAGGKTTLMLALGATLEAAGGHVLLTTTTRVGASQIAGVSAFWAAREEERKLIGPSPTSVDELWDMGLFDDVLVEADGARQRSVKAPAGHEPVIPSRTTLVVAVLGADALGRAIDHVAHRPERVAAVAGCGVEDVLTTERAVRIVTGEDGLRRSVPAAARFAVAITRIRSANRAAAGDLAARLEALGVTAIRLPWTPSLAAPAPARRRARGRATAG